MTKIEKRKFDAEIGKVLHLMIHSLYTNKDIFLRELISNSSDAFDKLRFESAKNDQLSAGSQTKIVISTDKNLGILKIRDFGIGMNKQDLIENLGTIARSGTQKFLEKLTGDSKKDIDLIGQFGVGFYSSFMVADEVIVKSRKAGEDKVWCWQSNGEGEFSVFEVPDSDFPCGSEISLRLKEGEQEYLDRFRIGHIVKTYSEHISLPVEFHEEGKESEVLNSSRALWNRPKSEITEDAYNDFYKQISYMPDGPWMTLHNKNEGAVEYTNLLFVPSSKTYDLFNPERKRSVKLYIKKIFINDEGVDLIPHYLRFLRGVVDSQDLPLNISRETLQHNKVLEKIKSAITKKVLSELTKRLEANKDDYLGFWSNFGAVLKEGLCEYGTDHESILDVSLFKSIKLNKYITLKEYIEGMQDKQEDIYYISGNDEESLKHHPQIEGFISKGIDVLLFIDTVDSFWVNVVHTYKEKNIKSVTRADIDLVIDKNQEQISKDNATNDEAVIAYFKEELKDLAKDVKISKKLTESPVCLAIAEGAMDMRMERFLAEQKQLKMPSAKILEININHHIISSIAKKLANGGGDEHTSRLVKLLFDQACILEGEPVQNAVEFSRRMNEILNMVVA